MDTTISHRPIPAMISLAAAVTLTVGTTAPSATTLHTPPAPHVVTQAVALTANPLEQIWDVFTGVDTSYPLPAGANPIAPITEQVLRSVATYSGQLLSGQGHLIPGEIAMQVKNLQDALPAVQELLIDGIAVIPVVAFSAFFLTAMVIGSLPASTSALPGLVDIWLRAVLFPPLKWVYNGFAIRNVIAEALQPPSSQPEPAAAVAKSSTEPAQRRASSARGATKAAAASSAPAKRAPASKRSAKPTAASSTTSPAKTGVAGSQRQRQAAP
jgi:hypothetical protein